MSADRQKLAETVGKGIADIRSFVLAAQVQAGRGDSLSYAVAADCEAMEWRGTLDRMDAALSVLAQPCQECEADNGDRLMGGPEPDFWRNRYRIARDGLAILRRVQAEREQAAEAEVAALRESLARETRIVNDLRYDNDRLNAKLAEAERARDEARAALRLVFLDPLASHAARAVAREALGVPFVPFASPQEMLDAT